MPLKMRAMGRNVAGTAVGVNHHQQTADGRNYSSQNGRSSVQKIGRNRFAVRPISFAVGKSGPRAAPVPCRSTEFLPHCVL